MRGDINFHYLEELTLIAPHKNGTEKRPTACYVTSSLYDNSSKINPTKTWVVIHFHENILLLQQIKAWRSFPRRNYSTRATVYTRSPVPRYTPKCAASGTPLPIRRYSPLIPLRRKSVEMHPHSHPPSGTAAFPYAPHPAFPAITRTSPTLLVLRRALLRNGLFQDGRARLRLAALQLQVFEDCARLAPFF